MSGSAGGANRASSCHVRSASGTEEQHTSAEESLDEAANSGRVDVDVKTEKRKKGCETTCAELLSGGVDYAVDLVEAGDDVG